MRLLARGLALVALALVGAPAALGHVGIEPATAPAGSEQTFTLTVPHGCAGSETTDLAIKLPASIRAAWPAPAAGWDLEATPIGDAGSADGETARRLDVVRWAGGRLPDGELGEFRIRLALPDEPGAVLVIPAVQTCADGETRWIQVPADGERVEDLPEPAPSIRLTAPDGVEASGDGPARADLALGLAVLGVLVAAASLIVALRSRPSR